MSLYSLVLGNALFPHCFKEQRHGVWFFGVWGAWSPLPREPRNRIQEGSVLGASYPSQPVRNMTPQERLCVQKEGAVEDSQT